MISDFGTHNTLTFADYIARTRLLVEKHRLHLFSNRDEAELAIHANTPYELHPKNPLRIGQRLKYGALLIHGLLDCPFSLRDIGTHLQAQGILSRAILLPGHGTEPSDLLHVSYQDWINTVRYGVESLSQEVENIFLIGYSTGAALSIHHALQDPRVTAMILLSPAIQIKTPVDLVVSWRAFMKKFSRKNIPWICKEKEIDYAKYKSIAFNAVTQVSQLTKRVRDLQTKHSLNTPICMILSHEDETISSHKAITFFSKLSNPINQLLLYSSLNHSYSDPRILTRQSRYPELNIRHFSHTAIPFASTNPHYGQQGDYAYASHSTPHFIYGAYNQIEEEWYKTLYRFGFIRKKHRELTYNPDFDFMMQKIMHFILTSP